MRIFKTILASTAFIPLSLLGQLAGYFFGLFCLLMWNSTHWGGVDGNSIIPFFSEFFPYVISGCFGGALAAFGVQLIYRKYHPTIILIFPLITTLLALIGNIAFLRGSGFDLQETGLGLGTIFNGAIFYLALRKDYPPILLDLEKLNKEVKSEFLQRIEGDRGVINSLARIDGVAEHRKILMDALDTAQESILLLSGFVSGFVIDKEFISKLEVALKRGVIVRLGFGWTHPSGNKGTRVAAKKELLELLKLASQNNGSGILEIYYFPNHSKVLIKDDSYSVEGSFNWLSTGDQSKNLETSIKLTDRQQVQSAFYFYSGKLLIKNIMTNDNFEQFSV